MKKFLHMLGVFSLIIGVPASIFGVHSFLYPDTAEPYYMIISDELAVSSPTSRIKLYFDSTEVPNVKVMQIALWNGGKNYIEKEKLINSYFAEVSSLGVKILQTDISKRSRKELNLKTKISKTKDRLFLFLEGREVVESKDGAVIKIFYTSEYESNWKINTRIKGVPNGFKKYSYHSSKSYSFKNTLINFSLAISFILFYGIGNYQGLYSKNLFSKIIAVVFMILLVLIFLLLLYGFINESVYFPDFIE